MARELKFRAFIDLKLFKVMIEEVQLGIDTNSCGCTIEQFEEAINKNGWNLNGDDDLVNESSGEKITMYDAGAHDTGEDFIWFDNCEIMQFTGRKEKKEVDIYESDIFRVEEDSLEPEDGDEIYYLAVVWIKEWAMFACLNITNGEYKQYLDSGVKALDEPMFWTYTLEDTSDRRFFLCGDIYQNHDLLK